MLCKEQSTSDGETEFIDCPPNIKERMSQSRVSLIQAKEDKRSLTDQNKELMAQITRLNELLDLKHKQNQQSAQEALKLREQVDDREMKLVQAMKEKQLLHNELIGSTEINHQFTQKEENLNSEIYALRLTMEQLTQNLTIAKQETNQIAAREFRLKEELQQVINKNQTLEAQLKKATENMQVIQKQMLIKDNEFQEIKRQKDDQLQQNANLITELIEQKNQNLSNSIYGKQNLSAELEKLNTENQQLKVLLKQMELDCKSRQEQDTQNQQKIIQYSQKLQEQHRIIEQLTQQVQQKSDQTMKLQQELKNNQVSMHEFQEQINFLQKQQLELIQKNTRSQITDPNIHLKNELSNKSEQIAMLQNENNQLVKLIDTLKSQKCVNQTSDDKKIVSLEGELKYLQSFIYESPIAIIFNLLEDRLAKQQKKSFEQKANLKEFWEKVLKEWEKGFLELSQAFQALKVVLKYELKYNG